MATRKENTTVNPAPTGFDLGSAGDTLLTLAADIVREHTAKAEETPATPAQQVAPRAAFAFLGDMFGGPMATIIIIVAGGALIGWLFFRK
jgi:hypothetical protein